MGKGSQRRPCLISREEEQLRWDLALGVITMDVFKMKVAKDTKKIGCCARCKDGLMTCPSHNYRVTCRTTNEVHSPHYTCTKFREDV